ncbi:hypothetical protein ACOME3_000054 [Neoechinorhynchus agilis]
MNKRLILDLIGGRNHRSISMASDRIDAKLIACLSEKQNKSTCSTPNSDRSNVAFVHIATPFPLSETYEMRSSMFKDVTNEFLNEVESSGQSGQEWFKQFLEVKNLVGVDRTKAMEKATCLYKTISTTDNKLTAFMWRSISSLFTSLSMDYESIFCFNKAIHLTNKLLIEEDSRDRTLMEENVPVGGHDKRVRNTKKRG